VPLLGSFRGIPFFHRSYDWNDTQFIEKRGMPTGVGLLFYGNKNGKPEFQ
jgi:hypothetical protein